MVPVEKPKAEFPAAEADNLVDKLVMAFPRWLASKSAPKVLWGLVEYLLTRAMGLIMTAAGWVGVKIATVIMKSEDLANPIFGDLSQAAIKDLTGVDVHIGPVGPVGTRGKSQLAAKNIGEALLKGTFGEFTGGTPSDLKPSSEGASKFLTWVMTLTLEGWLQGWIAEACSLGRIETFAELDDSMSQTLGLGRLSRRVLGPPMDIFVTTPFTWLLNKTYRPNLLGTTELIRQYIRGRATRERLFYEMALAGYKDEDTEALLATHQRFMLDTDLMYLVERGTWTEDQAIQHLRDQGYTEATAKGMLAVERDKKIDAYRKKMADVACDAFISRDIEEGQFRQLLASCKLAPWEEQWVRQVAGLRREFKTKDLSVSDVEQAVKRGIRSINDYRAHLLKLGYSLDDARTLELLLMIEVQDKAAADMAKAALAAEKAAEAARKAAEQAARRAEIEAEQAVRGVSLAQFEAMVRAGLRSIEQYRAFLAGLKYTPEDVSALAELLEGQIAQARTDAERREQLLVEARKRKISLADLERAVKMGLMSVDEYRSQLAAAGFGDEDRQLLAALLQRELDLARENEVRKAEAARRLAERRISLEDLERAVRLGQRTVAQYRARLIEEGFVPDEADLLAELLRGDVAADREARERRAEVEAALKRKKIPLSEMEQAVRAGIRTMGDYRALLLREGYSDQDAELLAWLLQLQVDADTQAAAKRKEAEARLAERRISLADVERAVKLGVMDLAGYKRVLTREGFTAEDQGILVQLLTAELAAIRDAERKRAAAEKEAAKRQISLADLERAVRVGVRTVVEYQGALQQLGYSAQDQATLLALLQLQMEQDAAARAKRQEAETALVQRGLSLAQWERSVLEGIRGMAEYRAWLREQGYGEEDAATLVALLSLELAERIAREEGPSP